MTPRIKGRDVVADTLSVSPLVAGCTCRKERLIRFLR
jgi:hypothetical protein